MSLKKKAASFLLAGCISLTSVPSFAVDIVQSLQVGETTSGECGGNLTWTLTDSGALTISGTGAMNSHPWRAENVTSITVEEGVTVICDGAFSGCKNAASVTLPNTVTSIGSSAFSGCSKLTSISIPKNVTGISGYTFTGCIGLTSVTLPSGIISIDASAFYGCSSLVTIDLPGGLATIGNGAFQNCASLSHITIPQTVTFLGTSAFYGCSNLPDITIPDLIKSIPNCAFQNCVSLKSITIPEGVTSIGAQAFSGCSSLESVTFPANLTDIYGSAFGSCTSLRNIYFKGQEPDYHGSSSIFGGVTATLYYPIGAWTERNGTSTYRGGTMTWATWNPNNRPDAWDFSNSNDAFGADSDGYYIKRLDYNRLIKNLSVTDAQNVSLTTTKTWFGRKRNTFNFNIEDDTTYHIDWGGSCYGMSIWVILANIGVRSPSDLNLSSLNVPINDTIESAINYYNFQQMMGAVSSEIDKFMRLTQVEQLSKLEELASKNSPFMIRFQWYRQFKNDGSCRKNSGTGHAVVGYGLESGSYPQSVNGQSETYTKRIKIYDPAYPNGGIRFYLYYNDAGNWCIPGWGIRSSSSQSRDSRANNGQLCLATDNVGIINAVDYKTGAKSSAASTDLNVSRLVSDSNSSYTISSNGESAQIEGGSVNNSTFSSPINIAVSANITSNGDAAPNATATAFLPESDDYTVTSNSNFAYQLTDGDYVLSAAANQGGFVNFSNSGQIDLNTTSNSNYSISVASNNSSLSWDNIEVTGENSKQASAKLTNNGVVIDGDNLDNITVTGSKDDETVELDVSSDKDTILVTEDKGNLIVKEDSNNDGSYDKVIGQTVSFTDVPSNAYYADAVTWAVDKGVTSGTSATTFSPDNSCTRAQIMQMLWRAAGSPKASSTSAKFTDVKSSDYFYDAVQWAVSKGITSGTSPSTFSPNATCTRAQAMTFLWNAKGKPSASNAIAFIDVQSGDYFYNPVKWAVNNGVTSGTSASTFSPTQNCTRAQIVTFIYKAMN